MNKQLIRNLTEYRQWAWDIWESKNRDSDIDDCIGILPVYECWESIRNENGDLIDVDGEGNEIPEDTAATIKLEEWVEDMNFPVIAVYIFDNDWDRVTGKVKHYICDFVSLSDFPSV